MRLSTGIASARRPHRLAAGLVVAVLLGASGCGGDDPQPLTAADLNADRTVEVELRNALFFSESAVDWDDDTPLTAADVALYRTVATVYFSPELHRSVLLQSLDDWDATAASLTTARTQPDDTAAETAARDQAIEEFKAQLERSVEAEQPVDVASFLQIPIVDRMIVQLENSYVNGRLDEVN